jgi:uncharacterized protein (DUF885 family)
MDNAIFKALLAIGVLALSVPMLHAHQPSTPKEQFRELYTREWQWRQLQQATNEDRNGPPRADLPDVGPAAQQQRLQYWQDVLRQLSSLDARALDESDRIDFQVYRAQVEALEAAQRFRDYERPLTSDTSFWGDLAQSARGPFATEADYRYFLSQLQQLPRYFRQNVENMRAGLRRGFTLPRVSLEGRDGTISSVIAAGATTENIYYTPFREIPAAIPPTVQAELRAEALRHVEKSVLPAYRELLQFYRNEYLPRAQRSIAAYDLPDGRAYYASKVREYTTLPMNAEDVHALGMTEVAAIRAEMQTIMTEVGFRGSLPEFLTFLRTDPQFVAKSPEELLGRAAWIAKRFDAVSERWFGRLPRKRFAIVPVPADVAPFYTAGRGGPGYYYLNTYNLPARGLYSLTALTLHESAPGHAFQMPLANENTALPAFRRETYLSVFGEGWALYSERLGVEMGLYETPYDRFGMLSYQMWRACRLVVDTGIHALKWPREKAQAFMRDNTALAEHEIITEVDRYIAWPGQALSYYIGELEILKARRRAEAALGARFDIRAFHDAVLALGSVPMPVLQESIDRFIANGGRSPYADPAH